MELFARFAVHFKTLTPIPESVTDGVADEQYVRNVADVLFVERRVAGKVKEP
jgi:hypothetical protein